MAIKTTPPSRLNLLTKLLKAVLVAVLPSGAALRVEMKANGPAKTETETEMKMAGLAHSEEILYEDSIDDSTDVTERVLQWQSGVVADTGEFTSDVEVVSPIATAT